MTLATFLAVQLAAYLLAEADGFAASPVAYWLAAERDVLARKAALADALAATSPQAVADAAAAAAKARRSEAAKRAAATRKRNAEAKAAAAAAQAVEPGPAAPEAPPLIVATVEPAPAPLPIPTGHTPASVAAAMARLERNALSDRRARERRAAQALAGQRTKARHAHLDGAAASLGELVTAPRVQLRALSSGR